MPRQKSAPKKENNVKKSVYIVEYCGAGDNPQHGYNESIRVLAESFGQVESKFLGRLPRCIIGMITLDNEFGMDDLIE